MRRAMICGAGIAGLTLAWWLRRDGWQVELVERATGPRDEGYMIDFFGSGYDVAELMGLVPRLREIHTQNSVVSYVDSNGRGAGRLEYHQFAAAFEDRGMTFMRGDLERLLYEELGPDAAVRYDTTIESVQQEADGVHVTLTDGSTYRVDLLVGADGIHSRVRELTFGPQERFLRYLGYQTASYLLDDDELRAAAGERFLIVVAPGHQFGLYPTRDGRLAAWAVHHADDPTLPADPRATLRERYADLGPLVQQALRHCPSGRPLYYDQVAQIEMPAWNKGAITLIGDAAQAVSLMAGQGASLAMGSAWMLALQLRTIESIPDALREYEQRMRPFVAEKQKYGRRTASWLLPATSRGIAVRRLFLAMLRSRVTAPLLKPGLRSMVESVVPR